MRPLIAIPVGYKVKLEIHGKVRDGIINKIMMPGYKSENFPGYENHIRYCIIDCQNIKISYIVPDYNVIDPDSHRLLSDDGYREIMEKKFKEFYGNKPKKITFKSMLESLISYGNLESKLTLEVNDKAYGYKSLEIKYNKIIVTLSDTIGTVGEFLTDLNSNIDFKNINKYTLETSPGNAILESIIIKKFTTTVNFTY